MEKDVRIKKLKEMRDVQGRHGNWNFNSYMHGLYNGLEFAVSTIEDVEPELKNAPEKWMNEKINKQKATR